MQTEEQQYTAFEGHQLIGSGSLIEVALEAKQVLDHGGDTPVLIFADDTGRMVEIDFRGTPAEVRERLESREIPPAPDTPAEAPRGPGRPKLGVVPREVTLLPRHWEWLNEQPGGASVALRKLVDEARRANEEKDRVRRAQEVTYRFMSAVAGDLPHFEEATRALFAGDRRRFEAQMIEWPEDLRRHISKLAQSAFFG